MLIDGVAACVQVSKIVVQEKKWLMLLFDWSFYQIWLFIVEYNVRKYCHILIQSQEYVCIFMLVYINVIKKEIFN